MAATGLTTTVSTKGQVILPKAIRQRRNWTAGMRLIVEDTPDGVLLKAAPIFAATLPEDVAGMLAYRGRPKTLEEMPPFRSYGHAFVDLWRNLADPRVGAQWREVPATTAEGLADAGRAAW